MSQIILLRHAKVIIDNPKIYSNQMGEFVDRYNSAPIENAEPSSRVKELVGSADIVVTSKLSRTVQTLSLFNKEPNLSSEIFNEAQLPYSNRRFIKLPAKVLAPIFRVLWLFGYKNHSESFAEAKHRAELGADMLIEFSKENKSVLLVGHGIMNRLIVKALVKRGAVAKEKTGDANLTYKILEIGLK